jgi:hypothetical protein
MGFLEYRHNNTRQQLAIAGFKIAVLLPLSRNHLKNAITGRKGVQSLRNSKLCVKFHIFEIASNIYSLLIEGRDCNNFNYYGN